MAKFKVPSPTPSAGSTSSRPGGSQAKRRTPERKLKGILKRPSASPLRNPKSVSFPPQSFKVPSATSSSNASNEDGDDERSPDPPAPNKEMAAEIINRLGVRSDFQHPIVLSDRESSSSESSNVTDDFDRSEVSHEPPIGNASKDEASGNHPSISRRPNSRHSDPESSQDPISNDTVRTIQKLLDHPNIVSLVKLTDWVEDDDYDDDSTSYFGVGLTLNDLILVRSLKIPQAKMRRGLWPESLIWHTLISLLRAVHYLHTGGCSSRKKSGRAGWQPVVNNFINPNNVVYMEPKGEDESHDAPYGICMLRNFSRCVVLTHIVDPEDMDEDESELAGRKEAFSPILNPSEETGFEAPEHFGYTENVPGPAADLWSIGAVIAEMMTGSNVWDLVIEKKHVKHDVIGHHRKFQHEGWQNVASHQRTISLQTLPAGELTSSFPKRYGENLKILVECLLSFDPVERGCALEALQDAELMLEERVDEVGEDVLRSRG